jgi:phosphoribosylformimino-5-aminoimidazole carboxamide ribotide isomerase
MFIIPVIDLLNGKVVHAKQGDRAHYQPLQSTLVNSTNPIAVAEALLSRYPTRHLYIADLNAIQKLPEHHLEVIQQIAMLHPNVSLWVDAGIANPEDLQRWSGHHFNLILGSENFSSLDNFHAVSSQLNQPFILSLDFMPQGYQGPSELIKNARYWPKKVILMTLANVGSGTGVDVELLKRFSAFTHQFELFAAGGVRDAKDIHHLKQFGIKGALVASALHNGKIKPDEIT